MAAGIIINRTRNCRHRQGQAALRPTCGTGVDGLRFSPAPTCPIAPAIGQTIFDYPEFIAPVMAMPVGQKPPFPQ